MSFSPKYVPRSRATWFYKAALLSSGDTLVGRRRVWLDKDTDAWSFAATGCDSLRDVWSVDFHTPIEGFVVHEDAGFVAVRESQRVSCYDLATGAKKWNDMDGYHVHVPLPGNRLLSLENVPAVLPDGTKLDQGTRACVLDLEKGVVATHFGLQDNVTIAPVDDAGMHLIACGSRTILWHLATRAPLLGLDEDAASKNLRFRPARASDGVLHVVNPYDFRMGGPLLLDVRAQQLRVEITRIVDPRPKSRGEMMSFSLSRDGRYLATAHADHIDNHHIENNAICIWDLDAKELVTEIEVRGEKSPDNYAWYHRGPTSLRGIEDDADQRVFFDLTW